MRELKKHKIDDRKICLALLTLSAFAIALVRLIKTGDGITDSLLSILITRIFLAATSFFLIRYVKIIVPMIKLKPHILHVPCFLVAINKLPFIALLRGTAAVTAPFAKVILFALTCIAVATCEELAFRGLIFLGICQSRRSKKGIFLSVLLSSAIFGLFHLFNLIDGAGIGSVIMQVGYSFLIGGMCATVLLACRSILPCIALHAIFNFCGGLIPNLGTGFETVWDPLTIVLTAVVAVVCAVFIIRYLVLHGDENIDSFYPQ